MTFPKHFPCFYSGVRKFCGRLRETNTQPLSKALNTKWSHRGILSETFSGVPTFMFISKLFLLAVLNFCKIVKCFVILLLFCILYDKIENNHDNLQVDHCMQMEESYMVSIVLGIILLVVAVFLVIAVLMQNGKSKNLSGAISGGAETFFGKTKGSTIDRMLSKVTTVVAILFVIMIVVVYVTQDVTDYRTIFQDALDDARQEAAAGQADDTENTGAAADGADTAGTDNSDAADTE